MCFCAPQRSPIHKIRPCDMYTFGRERMDRVPESFDAPVRGIVEGERLPLFAHHPLKGEGARYDRLPAGKTGAKTEIHEHRPGDPLVAKRHSYHFCDF